MQERKAPIEAERQRSRPQAPPRFSEDTPLKPPGNAVEFEKLLESALAEDKYVAPATKGQQSHHKSRSFLQKGTGAASSLPGGDKRKPIPLAKAVEKPKPAVDLKKSPMSDPELGFLKNSRVDWEQKQLVEESELAEFEAIESQVMGMGVEQRKPVALDADVKQSSLLDETITLESKTGNIATVVTPPLRPQPGLTRDVGMKEAELDEAPTSALVQRLKALAQKEAPTPEEKRKASKRAQVAKEREEEIQTRVRDMLAAKLKEVEAESDKIKLERQKLQQMQRQKEIEQGQIRSERQNLAKQRQLQLDDFEKYKKEEMSKINRARNLLDRQKADVALQIDRAHKAEVQELKEKINKITEEKRSQQQKNRMTIERLRRQIDDLSAKNADLEETISHWEKNRLDSWGKGGSGQARKADAVVVEKEIKVASPVKVEVPDDQVTDAAVEPVSVHEPIAAVEAPLFEAPAVKPRAEDSRVVDISGAEPPSYSERLSRILAIADQQPGTEQEEPKEDVDRQVEHHETIQRVEPEVLEEESDMGKQGSTYFDKGSKELMAPDLDAVEQQQYAALDDELIADEEDEKEELELAGASLEESQPLASTFKVPVIERENEEMPVPRSPQGGAPSTAGAKTEGGPQFPGLSEADRDKWEVVGGGSGHVRMERPLPDGGKVIMFSNGTQKELHSSGLVTVRFPNGDLHQTFPDKRVIYYYADVKTTHTTYSDGLEVYRFPNNQVERHFTDGRKEILFPDGITKTVSTDGTERSVFPDQTVQTIYPEGRRVIDFAGGLREVHETSGIKKRFYPSGVVRTYLLDGNIETVHPDGRVQVGGRGDVK